MTEGPTLLAAAKRAPAEARSRAAWLVAAALLVLGTIGLALGVSLRGRASPAGAASDVPAAASGSVAVGVQSEPATGAGPSSTATAQIAASDAAAPSSRRGPHGAPSSRPATKPNCDVPYVVDSSGRRQVKRECL